MSTVIANIQNLLSDCTPAERAEVFQNLAREVLLRPSPQPIPISNGKNALLGFVVPGTSPAEWYGLTEPSRVAEIKRRIAERGEMLSSEEFFSGLASIPVEDDESPAS